MMQWDAGKVVAYLGGALVSLLSINEKRQANGETVALMEIPLDGFLLQITLMDITTVGGFLIVVLRFLFDVYRFVEKRRRLKRNRPKHH